MPLFESREDRRARRRAKTRVAVQQGRAALTDYIKSSRTVGARYLAMAKKALSLGQGAQADGYLATCLQYQHQADRFESFQLMLDDIALRGKAMEAMEGMVGGITQLSKSLAYGLSAKEVQNAMVNLQKGLFKVDEAEAIMSNALSSFQVNVGPDSFDVDATAVPDTLRPQIEGLRQSLLEQLELEGAAPATLARASTSSNHSGGESVTEALERFQRQRQGGNGR